MQRNYLVNPKELQEFVKKIFMKYDLNEQNANSMAAMMVEANLRGVHSHGVLRVSNYVDRIIAGGLKKEANIEVIKETNTTATVDGTNSFGAVACEFAANLAREKAEKYGLGMVALKNTEHTGALQIWALKMAGKDMIGITGTATEPIMAPTGSKSMLIGNNPFSIVVPSGKYDPICLDMASSQVAAGKVFDKGVKKEEVPLGWILDEDGNPTTDPNKFKTLLPVGGHKGYGLAVIVELLSSILSGGPIGEDHGSMYGKLAEPNSENCFFITINISYFRELAEFKEDVDKYIELIHSSETAPGIERVFYPGEMEAEHKRNALINGVRLDENLINQLESYAHNAGLSGEEIELLKKTVAV
jgi:LDH2 family malate/lactate/ureidoglycolate dehydrogenase